MLQVDMQSVNVDLYWHKQWEKDQSARRLELEPQFVWPRVQLSDRVQGFGDEWPAPARDAALRAAGSCEDTALLLQAAAGNDAMPSKISPVAITDQLGGADAEDEMSRALAYASNQLLTPIAKEEGPRPISIAAALQSDSKVPLSVGSLGHPFSCKEPCKFVTKLNRGCKDAASCLRCHLCVWRKTKTGKLSGQVAKQSQALGVAQLSRHLMPMAEWEGETWTACQQPDLGSLTRAACQQPDASHCSSRHGY
eukprot:TRINITY_DN77042_c0_g1_i1.p1 TRINITY_DN77042_c0_g1~~TRINITY_DN77042_c0_g1_i1.p1  ORF type:complete len:252 (+),score=41.88 TRINITY_DN77042_c0_g1_i1:138-893(+)